MESTYFLLLAAFLTIPVQESRVVAFPDSSVNIVGGQNATEGEFPYQILIEGIQGFLFQLCGGALVEVNGTQVVLTSFTCAGRQRPEALKAVAGELSRSIVSGYEQRRKIRQIVNFPNQQSITMLILEKPFQLNSHIQPVSLPSPFQQFNGNVIASGWGSTKIVDAAMGERVEHPDTLHKLKLPTMSDEECLNQNWEDDMPVLPAPEILCTDNDYESEKSYCFGDQGGPMVTEDGQYLAGIMLYSYYCSQGGRERVPGLNIKVSHFLDWIEETARI